MIQLVFFLVLVALLFALLVLMARRRPRAEGSAEAILEARHALNSLQASLLPVELVERLFANEDFEYILTDGRARLRQMFLEERKRIVLLWVRQVHAAVSQLRRFYLGAARSYARLDVRMEMQLAWDFAVLLLACRALYLVLYLRGPYAAPRIVGTAIAIATRICGASENALAFLTPPELAIANDRAIGVRTL